MAIINSIRLALFTSAVYAWNRLMWPDEQEELRAAGDQSFHIILGRNPDGTINVMRTQGTMNAFMESMGINGIMQFYRDYQNNGATMQDVAKEPAKAFTNEMYQGLSPYIKAPVELLSGKSRFPNVFRPRAIRNTDWNLEYLMGSLALREPYEILSNKGIKRYFFVSTLSVNRDIFKLFGEIIFLSRTFIKLFENKNTLYK
jgi:hypothetical protein